MNLIATVENRKTKISFSLGLIVQLITVYGHYDGRSKHSMRSKILDSNRA